MTRELARHEYQRERLEYNEERDWYLNAILKKEEMWKPVCELWYMYIDCSTERPGRT